MARKIIKPISKEPEDTTENIYSETNHLEMERLRKITNPSKPDMDSIFHLYKLYVNPQVKSYQTSCNCNSSIVTLYWKLMAWYKENITKFA